MKTCCKNIKQKASSDLNKDSKRSRSNHQSPPILTPNLHRKNSISNNSSPRTPNLSKSFSKLKTKTPTNNNRTARNYTKDEKGLLLFEKILRIII